MQNQRIYKTKNMQGYRYEQPDIELNLSDTFAGSTIIVKLMLILPIFCSCFLLNFINGYFASTASLHSVMKTKYGLGQELMLFILLVWMIVAIYQEFNKSILITVFSTLISLTFFGIITILNLVKLSENFLFITTGNIIIGLIICSANFFFVRFGIAFTNLTFVNSYIVKTLGIFLVTFATIAGSLQMLALVPSSDFKIETTPTIKLITIISGITFSLTLVLSSWWANRLRGVPWNHPDLLRDWALAVGSWRGTSFYNLDLSNVNFRNAKLANTDLRAKKLYRTCFQGVKGLARARVDSRYLDLENLKVQKLLTSSGSEDGDFSELNLRGAYLQNAAMRDFNFTDTDLTGSDLQGADLRGSAMVRAQVIGVDFTKAKLTGVCIQDWSVNSQTDFTDVECNYVYRSLDENGKPTDKFPANRNFEPSEFESLYQEVENVVELIFKEGENWQAALFSLKKLQIEDEEMGLELKGVEKRGDRWVVKISYNKNYPKQEVEQHLNAVLKEVKHQLAVKEREVNKLQQGIDKLLDISADQAATSKDQAAALKELSRKPFGNSFVITGSTITNLAGSGEIDYNEAFSKIRSLVANGSNPTQVTIAVQSLLEQFQRQSVATTLEEQAELLLQMILAEAKSNPDFQQLFIRQGEQIAEAIPEGAIAAAIKKAIAQLG